MTSRSHIERLVRFPFTECPCIITAYRLVLPTILLHSLGNRIASGKLVDTEKVQKQGPVVDDDLNGGGRAYQIYSVQCKYRQHPSATIRGPE